MFNKNLMKIFLAVFIFLSSLISYGQGMKDYEGGWLGTIEDSTFVFDVVLRHDNSTGYNLEVKNKYSSVKRAFNFINGIAEVSLGDGVSFTGYKNENKIEGFITAGIMKHHITLAKNNEYYTAQWHLFTIKNLQKEFFLSIEDAEGSSFNAYSISGDLRVPNFMNFDFKKSNDTIFFKDFRTGLKYSVKLNPDKFILNFVLFDKKIAAIEMHRITDKWKPKEEKFLYTEKSDDGLQSTTYKQAGMNEEILKIMDDSAAAGNFYKTHSILIARNGKIVFEKYYGGYDAVSPHDMRSASKTISSAVTGIAINRGFIKNRNEYLYNLLAPKYKKYFQNDSLKKLIKLKHLMTMSSGLDAIDFEFAAESKASEDNYQNTDDWAKTVLEAPMINSPGTHALYGSANPFLLGLALTNSVNEPLELFMHRNLFEKLGIDSYLIQDDIEGNVYFAGGMYMTSRDMLKFGLLYLDSGKWNGEQVIPENWVRESFGKYLKLENTDDKNDYGYFWWHNNYKKEGEIIESIEARGAGGQYIILIPKYNLAAVITSGNFRNGKYRQPEKIMQEYILPAVK